MAPNELLLEKKFSNHFNWYSATPLIFSLIYFMGLFFQPLAWHDYLLITLGYFAFVGLYILCKTKPQWTLLGVALTACIMLALSPIYGFSYCLIWNSAYFVVLRYPKEKALILLGLLLLLILLSGALSKLHVVFYLLAGGIPFLGLAIFGFQDKRIQHEERVKEQKNREVEQLAAIAERERIARDMHDVLGHSLTAISLKSQLAAKLANRGQTENAVDEINAVQELCSSALVDLRQAISNYKAKGLAEQLEKLTGRLEQAGFSVKLQVEKLPLGAIQESNLVLILTEAVTNILRHSQGDSVTITLKQKQGKLFFEINDNGAVTSFKRGNGIKGIEERLTSLGGSLSLSTSKGFALEVTL